MTAIADLIAWAEARSESAGDDELIAAAKREVGTPVPVQVPTPDDVREAVLAAIAEGRPVEITSDLTGEGGWQTLAPIFRRAVPYHPHIWFDGELLYRIPEGSA